MEYYNLIGIQYTDTCDDSSAMEAYAKGLNLAIEIKNLRLCACFYNNIAELFYDNKAYKEAEEFYLKAISYLEQLNSESLLFNQKAILINLVLLSCHQKKIHKAKHYLTLYKAIICDVNILPFMELLCEIRIAMLEKNSEIAILKANELKNHLTQCKEDIFVLQPVYMGYMEILLELGIETLATWCIHKIQDSYTHANPKILTYIQQLRIAYHESFQISNDTLYADFYSATLHNMENQKQATADCFKSFVSLYNAEKKQQGIEKEQQDWQNILNRDGLTNLYNRRYYDKIILKAIQNHQVKNICYIMIDIDCFKQYNDYYGHAKGDIILKKVAELLQDYLPTNSYAARYGGDEFSCLLIDKSDHDILDYIHLIQNSLCALHMEHIHNQASSIVSLSFGIYNAENSNELSMDALIKKADDALYEAKVRGRNTYVFHKHLASEN